MAGKYNVKELLKVGVSGVRGVVGISFTPQLAAGFAQAFGTFVGAGRVLVGRDTRPTGVMIEHAVVAGLQSVGCTPILCGVVPTPTILMLTKTIRARGAIVITASHNPADWNALKFVGTDGLFLSEPRAEELFDIYHQQDFPIVREDEIRKTREEKYPTEEHFKQILRYVDTPAIKKRKLKVAVDCCNGVGAIYSPFLLGTMLGCEVYPVYDSPSGLFERDPEPRPESLGVLKKTVIENGCDIGFAQDPDGDRLSVVDEKGETIGEDMTLALAVWQVLEHHDKGSVCINMPTSKIVDIVAGKFGCPVIRTKIGEINVAESMIRNNAVVGGENIGGVMISKIHPCRDSFSGMAVILEMLVKQGRTVSELTGSLPSLTILREKISMRPEHTPRIIRHIRHTHDPKQLNLLDGIFIDLGDSWVHVRRSNTESVLRITAEAEGDVAAQALIDRYKKIVTEISENGDV